MFLGYAVYEDISGLPSYGYTGFQAGTATCLKWPIAGEDATRFSTYLKNSGNAHLLNSGALPELATSFMLVSDKKYIQEYLAYCDTIGIKAHAYAFATVIDDFASLAWDDHAVILGYDCVSSYSLASYLFYDNHGMDLALQKMDAIFLLNRHHYFAKADDAIRYGKFRRECIENGQNLEDLGVEMPLAVAMIV